jgi:hypothetical protein
MFGADSLEPPSPAVPAATEMRTGDILLGEVMTVKTLALGRADEPDHARPGLPVQ